MYAWMCLIVYIIYWLTVSQKCSDIQEFLDECKDHHFVQQMAL